MKKPRVVIADDHPEIVTAITRLLRHTYEVVAGVMNGVEAIDSVMTLRPDVLVLDIMMPKMDGIEVAQYLRACGVSTRIVFLSSLESADVIAHVMSLGPYSYVRKVRFPVDLPAAIAATLEGRVFCSEIVID